MNRHRYPFTTVVFDALEQRLTVLREVRHRWKSGPCLFMWILSGRTRRLTTVKDREALGPNAKVFQRRKEVITSLLQALHILRAHIESGFVEIQAVETSSESTPTSTASSALEGILRLTADRTGSFNTRILRPVSSSSAIKRQRIG